MADGVQSFEEAWNASKLELETGAGAPENAPGAPPPEPLGEPAPSDPDQPSEADSETQALIDSLVESPADEGAVAFDWNAEVEVDGGMMTLGEMRNGYLRHSDYTKKTQALAEQRKNLERADEMFNAFSQDPSEFARTLAVQYGWLEDSVHQPIEEMQFAKPLSQEELDAKVDELVNERVASDPSVQEAKRVEAVMLVHGEFDRIEDEMRITIPEELRESLIAEAQERNVYDLELLLKARLASRNQRTSDNLARTGAARPTSRGVLGNVPDEVEPPSTFEEAWAQAKAEAGR